MRFSVFTPSHTLKRIDRPLKSLQEQSFKDFEWIVCLNGAAASSEAELSSKLSSSGIKYKILIHTEDTDKIGFLKNRCCHAAAGEILVELDHDDELSPDCLEEIDLHDKEHNSDFYYSDDIDIVESSGESIAPYSEEGGWSYYKCARTGHTASSAFPPDPIAFGYIWYAPNHVRAWKKDFYFKIG